MISFHDDQYGPLPEGLRTFPYLLYKPNDANDRKYPLLIVLHGRNERKNTEAADGQPLPSVDRIHEAKQLRSLGPFRRIEKGRLCPMIVVAPVCPVTTTWPLEIASLNAFLGNLLKCDDISIDDTQVFLTGYDMGGFATWLWGVANPKQFAALAPISSGGGGYWLFDLDPGKSTTSPSESTTEQFPRAIASEDSQRRLEQYQGPRIWAFHDPLDQIHAFGESEILVKQAQAAKADVVLSEVRSEDPLHHEAWKEVYAADPFYDWLLDSTRDRAWQDDDGDRHHSRTVQSAAVTFKPYFDMAYHHVQLEQSLLNNRFAWCMAGNAVLAILFSMKPLERSYQILASIGAIWNLLAFCTILLTWHAESSMHALTDEILERWKNSVPMSSWIRDWLPTTMAGGGSQWVHSSVRVIGLVVFLGFFANWILAAFFFIPTAK